MPVDFLTPEQESRYGRYTGSPSVAQLARYFHLDDRDLVLVSERRSDYNKLGFALQTCTVRFLGIFLPDPTDVPANVVAYVAAQVGVSDTTCLGRYREGQTHWEHASKIKQLYGYRDFSDQPEHFRLVRWLNSRSSVEKGRVRLWVTPRSTG